jgi:hypothetical protein
LPAVTQQLDAAIAAWAALRSHLERRARELSDEVRGYPGPIARCDVQLTKLIEQRTRAFEHLKILDRARPDRRGLAVLQEFLTSPRYATEDEAEIASRSELSRWLGVLQRSK